MSRKFRRGTRASLRSSHSPLLYTNIKKPCPWCTAPPLKQNTIPTLLHRIEMNQVMRSLFQFEKVDSGDDP